jgi:hypothetical protein
VTDTEIEIKGTKQNCLGAKDVVELLIKDLRQKQIES